MCLKYYFDAGVKSDICSTNFEILLHLRPSNTYVPLRALSLYVAEPAVTRLTRQDWGFVEVPTGTQATCRTCGCRGPLRTRADRLIALECHLRLARRHGAISSCYWILWRIGSLRVSVDNGLMLSTHGSGKVLQEGFVVPVISVHTRRPCWFYVTCLYLVAYDRSIVRWVAEFSC